MSKALHGSDEAALQMLQALGLPNTTTEFTLHVKAGEAATVLATALLDTDSAERIAEITTRYELREAQPADIDALCAAAMARIVASINRSAGQHLRAMRAMRAAAQRSPK